MRLLLINEFILYYIRKNLKEVYVERRKDETRRRLS
jgi:hypothetical protein